MEGRRQLGVACRSANEQKLNALRRWIVGAVLSVSAVHLCAQTSAQQPSKEQLQQLASSQRWDEMVALLEPVRPRTAEIDFSLGVALAQMGRFAEAQSVLEEGRSLAPNDARFPVELAGVAFKQKEYPVTVRELRRALQLSPDDKYANDFLGTTYFLEGNLDAALKYWNRVGKPQIAAVHAEPAPRLSSALLDHALAFSPAAQLTLPQLADSEARLRGLGVFPQFHFDLDARDDGRFDVVFRGRERDGAGDGTLQALLLFFEGIPFQEVNPSYYNLHGKAINFDSMFRWDAQKRRIAADFSGPFERSATNRWQMETDLRNENWAIRNGFAGPAPVLASLNLRDEGGSFGLAHASDRLGWLAGAEISHRNFRGVEPGTTAAGGAYLTPQMLAAGYELKQQARVTSTLWREPDHRFSVVGAATSDAGRVWSQPAEGFEKLAGSIGWHWFPQTKSSESAGDDYETMQTFYAGRTFGQVPFDELFILGLERDNDLPLRAHIGTRDGRKGSAPLGRDYVLENWETNKNVYGNGIFKAQLGPFCDFGKITDPGTALGSREWLFDTGAQAKLRVLGVGLVFSYGKDLRTGNNAFYLSLLE
jgi:tetratricopeptide (TPR) repeat protein